MKNFLIKYPSRGRPDKFKSTLLKHISCLSNQNKYKFIFSFDKDDEKMNNNDVRNFIKSLKINHRIYYGDNKNKIEAINANMKNHQFDILVLISDDMIPEVENYDLLISQIIDDSPYKLDTMIHFNTSRWANLLDIWCIMGKEYYDRFNYIYHPDYKSINCDNEYTEVATLLNRRVFSEKSPFHHNWCSDETTSRNGKYEYGDYHTYVERKKINFGLKVEK